MKFCIDCRHAWREFDFMQWRCRSPKAGEQSVNVVTGEPIPLFCEVARLGDGPCGRNGNLWEPKESEKAPF